MKIAAETLFYYGDASTGPWTRIHRRVTEDP